jgi:hypothetical protein
MRGKVTYRSGRHPSRAADWVGSPDLGEEDLQRELARVAAAPPELRALVREGRYLRRAHVVDAVASRDVAATLAAMARIGDDAAAAIAMRDCDATTAAALALPLQRASGGPAERLRAAAVAALSRWRGRKPRKGYQAVLAREILADWELRTGDATPPVWGDAVACSPVVAHATEVFSWVEGRRFDVKKARVLLRGAVSTP